MHQSKTKPRSRETMIHKLEQTSSHTEVCGLMLTAGGGGGNGRRGVESCFMAAGRAETPGRKHPMLPAETLPSLGYSVHSPPSSSI